MRTSDLASASIVHNNADCTNGSGIDQCFSSASALASRSPLFLSRVMLFRLLRRQRGDAMGNGVLIGGTLARAAHLFWSICCLVFREEGAVATSMQRPSPVWAEASRPAAGSSAASPSQGSYPHVRHLG